MSSADFSGWIPRRSDECLGPLMFEPYANDLVRRVPPRRAPCACSRSPAAREL